MKALVLTHLPGFILAVLGLIALYLDADDVLLFLVLVAVNAVGAELHELRRDLRERR